MKSVWLSWENNGVEASAQLAALCEEENVNGYIDSSLM